MVLCVELLCATRARARDAPMANRANQAEQSSPRLPQPPNTESTYTEVAHSYARLGGVSTVSILYLDIRSRSSFRVPAGGAACAAAVFRSTVTCRQLHVSVSPSPTVLGGIPQFFFGWDICGCCGLCLESFATTHCMHRDRHLSAIAQPRTRNGTKRTGHSPPLFLDLKPHAPRTKGRRGERASERASAQEVPPST